MTIYGTAIDCVGHPTGAQVKAAGHCAVALYVGTPGRAKAATRELVADYLGHGLELVLVYEDNVGTWRGGHPRGLADALAVRAHLDDLGVTWANVACVFHAYDSDVESPDFALAEQYAAGVAAGYGSVSRVGVYGSRALIKELLDHGTAGWAWAAAGWQYGHIDPRCVLEQEVLPVKVGGVSVDINQILTPDFGQYPAVNRPADAPDPSPPADVPAAHTASEDAVALVRFDPTLLPADPPGGRWQDTDPASWPRSEEERTALVPAVAGGWRGLGSISSITCGWAGDQDGPNSSGYIKPSGYIEYMRIFGFTDITYKDWRAVEVLTNVPMVGNRSLPAIALPDWCTNLVVKYSAPGGLYLGIEYQR